MPLFHYLIYKVWEGVSLVICQNIYVIEQHIYKVVKQSL